MHKQDCNLYFALGFSVAASPSTYISNSQFAWIIIVLAESSTARSSSRAKRSMPFHMYFHLGTVILNYFLPTHSFEMNLNGSGASTQRVRPCRLGAQILAGLENRRLSLTTFVLIPQASHFSTLGKNDFSGKAPQAFWHTNPSSGTKYAGSSCSAINSMEECLRPVFLLRNMYL